MTMTAEERADFRALCGDFFARQAGEDRLRRYLETPAPGFDQELWADLTELGVVLAALPEDLDGGGAGVQDLAVAVEEAGRVLHGAPLTTTLVVARVLARYGFLDEHPEVLAALEEGAVATFPHDVGPDLAAADPADDVLAHLVPDPVPGAILVVPVRHAGGTALGIATCDRLRGQTLSTMDLTRSFRDVTVPPGAWAGFVTDPGAAAELFHTAVALQAAESVAVATTAFRLTLDYAKQRRQFDRAIGGFQAIKHRLADMYIELQCAEVAANAAAEAIDSGTDVVASVHTAKSVTGRAASWITSQAQQIHGGIGFTWEHVLHLYLRRAKVNELLLGSPSAHEVRLVSALDGKRDDVIGEADV
jgi:alkylation response protein AidB-like acyl-CoA dehydrogenase